MLARLVKGCWTHDLPWLRQLAYRCGLACESMACATPRCARWEPSCICCHQPLAQRQQRVLPWVAASRRFHLPSECCRRADCARTLPRDRRLQLHCLSTISHDALAWRGYRMAWMAQYQPRETVVVPVVQARLQRPGPRTSKHVARGEKRSVWLSVMAWRDSASRIVGVSRAAGEQASTRNATRRCRHSLRSNVGSPQHKMVTRCRARERI
jgi:hypothetical protein